MAVKKRVRFTNIPAITLLAVILAIAGIATMLYSRAATSNSKALQAEAGTSSGAAKAVTNASDASGSGYVQLNSGASKPRMIVMTDGEIDDQDSFIRFLLYTNDFDVKGIVETNSCWQRTGHSGESWMEDLLNIYEDVRPSLIQHDPSYPTADYLRSVAVVGQEKESTLYQAMPHNDTAGSELILNEIRKNDPRPLYINAWGGSNTTAHALYKLKTNYPSEYAAGAAKVKLHTIHSPDCDQPGQDGGWKWIGDNIPAAEVIVDRAFNRTWDYWGDGNPFDGEYKSQSSGWILNNVKNNHGPLGAAYRQSYVSEGDTPSFMWLVQNGLRGYEHPSWGGWGGRYKLDRGNVWIDAADDGSTEKAMYRWFPAAQNDFAARMDWTTKPFNGANHKPVVAVNGSLDRTVTPGSTVQLSAQVSDPDAHTLTSQWWQYKDADSAGDITIVNANSATGASFTVPNEPGKTIHVILESTDNGSPALKQYARIVFTIAQ